MYWHEADSQEKKTSRVSRRVADLCFKITCRSLPVDHVWALQEALCRNLPWLRDEPLAAIHPIHGATSGNGWRHPERHDDLVYLSQRTRLRIRLPHCRIEQAQCLAHRQLDIAGHALRLGASRTSLLVEHQTLFVRYLPDNVGNENDFLAAIMHMLQQKSICPPRIMTGRQRTIRTPDGRLNTRSIMVDGLDPSGSLLLQEEGLGQQRCLGCGIFLPHKSIAAVHRADTA